MKVLHPNFHLHRYVFPNSLTRISTHTTSAFQDAPRGRPEGARLS
jgi:hypothetical protein